MKDLTTDSWFLYKDNLFTLHCKVMVCYDTFGCKLYIHVENFGLFQTVKFQVSKYKCVNIG